MILGFLGWVGAPGKLAASLPLKIGPNIASPNHPFSEAFCSQFQGGCYKKNLIQVGKHLKDTSHFPGIPRKWGLEILQIYYGWM